MPTESTVTSETTLDQYELAGKPTNIDEVNKTVTDDIVESFDRIERFQTAIQFNGQNDLLLVGRSIERNPKTYRLYHWPEQSDKTGYAGDIIYREDFNLESDNDHFIGFSPAGDNPNEETRIIPISSLTVSAHDRTEQLDEILPAIRTELTESDWTGDGRADTNYGEWIGAVNELADYIADFEEPKIQFPPQTVMRSKIMHAIARYPLDAEHLLTQVADAISENEDRGVYDASPETFRTILFQFGNDCL